MVTAFRVRAHESTSGQFDCGKGADREAGTPWAKTRIGFQGSATAGDEDNIDGHSHEAGMNRRAGRDDQRGSVEEFCPPKQAAPAA